MADNQVYLRWCVPWFPRIGGWLRQSRWPEKERQPGGAMSQAEQEMRSRAWLRGTRSDFRRLRSLVKVLSPQASGRTFGSARGVMLGRGDIRIHFFLFLPLSTGSAVYRTCRSFITVDPSHVPVDQISVYQCSITRHIWNSCDRRSRG